jgi:hypothetical protein
MSEKDGVFQVTHGPSGLGYINGEAIIRPEFEHLKDGYYFFGEDGKLNGPSKTKAGAIYKKQAQIDGRA